MVLRGICRHLLQPLCCCGAWEAHVYIGSAPLLAVQGALCPLCVREPAGRVREG